MEQKKNDLSVNINDLKVIWRIISRDWYIPVIVVSIFYVIGYFYVYKLTNVFQASVELLKSNDTYQKENLITDQGFYGGAQSFIDNSNEIRIIKSYDLMKETILKLKDRLQISYFLVGRVRTTEQFSGCPFHVKVSAISPSLNEATIVFKIKNYNEYILSYFVNGVEVIKPGFFEKELVDTDLNIMVTREANFNRNTTEQLTSLNYSIIIHDLTNLIFQYQQSLAVQNPEYTNVLVLTLDDIYSL